MEKLLKPYDKEFMRMAMLKHEETFKEQVYELHRLYRIQKILMKNIENSRPNGGSQELWNSSNNGISFEPVNQRLNTQQKSSMMKLDLEQPADEHTAESNGDNDMLDESEIELTLGPANYSRKKKPVTPRTASRDSGPSFSSSSSTGSSHIKKTNIRAREVLAGCELGLVQVPDSVKNEEQLMQQERLDQQPSWLFQVLSLNMT